MSQCEPEGSVTRGGITEDVTGYGKVTIEQILSLNCLSFKGKDLCTVFAAL